MKAYYYDDLPGDPRLPHTTPHPIPPDHLATLGLHHTHIPVPCPSSPSSPADYSSLALETLASSRSYANRDTITVSPEAMGAVYEDKIKMFFAEHMHEDEEIRYILEGAGYFDVREAGDDRWVRVRLERGDLLVLPAGIYHRFTVDEGNYIKAMRLFKEAPKWTPLNRGPDVDENPYRKEYLHAREQALAREQETVG